MRVLVLDDDVTLRRIVAAALRDGGAAVDEAGTLAEAEERLQLHEYDVAVLDRCLPNGDASDLVSTLRKDGMVVPTMFLTALGDVDSRIDGLDAGADDYLAKPFATTELLARVRALSRRPPAVHSPVVSLGDLAVDPARSSAIRGGRDIVLTAKEFSLLLHLVRSAGRTVSRSELIEHCWDEFADPVSNVVDVRMRLLRAKLGEPTLLHTVRGVGYLAEVRG